MVIILIDLNDFLKKNIKGDGAFALVTYNKKTEPIYFSKIDMNGENWYLESPCSLFKICKIKGNIDTFCLEYVNNLCLEEWIDEYEYIEKFIKPMIYEGFLYEIENFQCAPYLPKEVEDIKIISERECLEYMLKNMKIK